MALRSRRNPSSSSFLTALWSRATLLTKMIVWTCRLSLPMTARFADRILTISESTRTDILNVLNVDSEKVRVIYHGRDEDMIKLPDDRRVIVHEIGIRSTKFRTFDNTLVIVPNAELIKFFAKKLGVRQNQVTIITGATNRKKRIKIDAEISLETFGNALGLEFQKTIATP